jgi:hypothetical protein
MSLKKRMSENEYFDLDDLLSLNTLIFRQMGMAILQGPLNGGAVIIPANIDLSPMTDSTTLHIAVQQRSVVQVK